MVTLKSVLVAVLAATVSSCVTSPGNPSPAIPKGHNFFYRVPLREEVNLIQAFDDGTTTYLQFEEMPAAGVKIRRLPENADIPYTVEGHYLKVAGVYDALRISVAGHSSSVINEAPASTPAALTLTADRPKSSEPTEVNPMSAVVTSKVGLAGSVPSPEGASVAEARRVDAPPVGVPETLQTMHANLKVAAIKQEVATLEDRVRALAAELDEAHQRGGGASLFLREVGGATRAVLTFEDESSEVQVDERLLDALANAAGAANRIYLHGHTDAYVASQRGAELAIRRAVEVRKALVSRSVEPGRIRLFYRGAGNFLANNSTPEGKALNRRVEIEMRKW